jgi:hypothetical protein
MRTVRHPQKRRAIHPRVEKMNRRRRLWKEYLDRERKSSTTWQSTYFHYPSLTFGPWPIDTEMLEYRLVRKYLAEDPDVSRYFGYIIKSNRKFDDYCNSKSKHQCKRESAKKERQYYRDNIRHYMNGRIEDIDHVPVSRLVTMWDYW